MISFKQLILSFGNYTEMEKGPEMSNLKFNDLLNKLLAYTNELITNYDSGKGAHWFLIAVLDCLCDETDFKISDETKNVLTSILKQFTPDLADKPRELRERLLEVYKEKSASYYDEKVFDKALLNALEAAEQEGASELRAAHLLTQVLQNADVELKGILQPEGTKVIAKEADADDKENDFDNAEVSLPPDFSYGRESDSPFTQTDTAQKETTTVQTTVTAEATETAVAYSNEEKKERIEKLTQYVKEMQAHLSRTVLGQENAIDIVTSGYFHAELVKITEKDRPQPKATFLFAGPPGVGKTFLAETFAEYLGIPHHTFDMSSYSDKDALVSLIGADAVWKDSEPGELTTFLQKNPKSVIIFDEIEKAHLNVIHLFLQILDGRKVVDKKTNKEVAFNDAILIFTTNAGKQLYEETDQTDFSSTSRRVILESLRKDINPQTKEPFFPAAICSRFATGNVIMFNHMTAHILYDIAKKEILKSADGISKQFGVDFEIAPEVYSSLLFSEGGDVDARTMTARAGSFLHTEFYELLRLVSSKDVEESIVDLKKIKVFSDISEQNTDIVSLFENLTPQEAMVFASKEMVSLCKEMSDNSVIMNLSSSVDQAKVMFEEKDIEMVFVDIGYGLKIEKNYLNLEDVESDARDFLFFVREQYPEIGIYLLVSEKRHLSEEEKVSFLRQGIRGLVYIGDREQFKQELDTIAVINHQQKAMHSLIKSNKLVTFETAQTIQNGEAEIVLFDHKFSVAVSAEDAGSIELQFFVKFLKNPKSLSETKMKVPRGVILYGPPGTGKTMLAKAMAHESDVVFIPVEGSSFLKQYQGQGAEAVRELFAKARKYAPSIIFIDEIDAIAKQRTGDNRDGTESIVNQFLTEMDGFKTNPKRPVFVLAATNFDVEPGSPKSLDEAFMRRFAKHIFIDLPDKEARIEYIKMKVEDNKKVFKISDSLIENIAIRSTGRSLADLENVFEAAIRDAVMEEKTQVTDEGFEESYERYFGGDSKQWDESLLLSTARHEAGHAFLYWKAGNTPSYVTIVARGDHGGYMQHGEQKKQVSNRKELLDRILTSLGGRAAEIVYYGEEDGATTGAYGDLYQATMTARNMICAFGMVDEFGLSHITQEEYQSGALSEKIHDATNAILAEQLQKAIEIIRQNRKSVDALVDVLMVKNHLTGDQIVEIFEANA